MPDTIRSVDYYLCIVYLTITILGPWVMIAGAALAANGVI